MADEAGEMLTHTPGLRHINEDEAADQMSESVKRKECGNGRRSGARWPRWPRKVRTVGAWSLSSTASTRSSLIGRGRGSPIGGAPRRGTRFSPRVPGGERTLLARST